MPHSHFLKALPKAHEQSVLRILDVAGQSELRLHGPLAQVQVGGEQLLLPTRLQAEVRHWEDAVLEWHGVPRSIALTLATRHTDGFYRESCLRRMLPLKESWQVPYVVALLGEYVAEISTVAIGALEDSPDLFHTFCQDNRPFLETTLRRAISYHDCYYRASVRSYKQFPAVALLTRALQMG